MPIAFNATEQDRGSNQLEVTANGNRRMLEALYLELRDLAKQRGLKIEYRLSREAPEDPSKS